MSESCTAKPIARPRRVQHHHQRPVVASRRRPLLHGRHRSRAKGRVSSRICCADLRSRCGSVELFLCVGDLLAQSRYWEPSGQSRYTAHTTIDIGVLAEQLRRRPSLFLEMPYLLHLLSSSESMDMNSSASLDFGSTCSNPSINLKYSGPSLSISASACLVSISTVLGSVVG
jgi:hypothetical protein